MPVVLRLKFWLTFAKTLDLLVKMPDQIDGQKVTTRPTPFTNAIKSTATQPGQGQS
jgi:hypothetical protein